MKAFFLFAPILGLTLLSCQSKPQGETIPLSPAPVQATEQNLKAPKSTAETHNTAPVTQRQDEENPIYHKPVRIKVRRDGKNNYTWELTGDSVKEIVAMDRDLRKNLLPGEETSGGGTR